MLNVENIHRGYYAKTQQLVRGNHRKRDYHAPTVAEYLTIQFAPVRYNLYFFTHENAPESFNIILKNNEWGQTV